MNKIFLLIVLVGNFFSIADCKIRNINAEIINFIENNPEKDVIRITFDVEVKDIIDIIDRQITLIDKETESLFIELNNNDCNPKMYINYKIIENIEEMDRLKEVKYRLQYYLTIKNHSVL